MSAQTVIQFNKISYTYEGQDEPALRNINFSIAKGEWVSIVGPGGAGKTTICGLLCGLLQTWPGSIVQGSLHMNDRNITNFTALDLAGEVGLISEDSESALIHNFVEDELAFGPENLGIPPDEIERRIDQTLQAVSMPNHARRQRTRELSGGQQQRIAIASVLTMLPGILVLDNAAANLDAPGTERLISTLRTLHAQGHTIICTSTRLEQSFEGDRVIALENGRIVADGPVPEMISNYKEKLIQLGSLPAKVEAPSRGIGLPRERREPLLQVEDLYFAYPNKRKEEHQPVLQDVNMELYEGEFAALLGPNGSGKTTLGKLIAGLLPSPRGAISIRGKDIGQYSFLDLAKRIGYVFQRPEHQFVAETVLEECAFGLDLPTEQIMEWLTRYGLYECRHSNPYRLGTADKRMLNLLTVMIRQPELLILDEPTAGLDYESTDCLMRHCADYALQGNAVFMITHDIQTVHKWVNKEIALGLY